MKYQGLILLFIIMIGSSCKKEKTKPECDTTGVTYNNTISAIIASSCLNSSCHGAGSSNPNFTTYLNLKPYLDNGKFKNEVLEKMAMPKNSSLSQDQLNKIQCWVESNYPEN